MFSTMARASKSRPLPTTSAPFRPARSLAVIQRKCACGGFGCSRCASKLRLDERAQRRGASGPLPDESAATHAEPQHQLGHDFAKVSIYAPDGRDGSPVGFSTTSGRPGVQHSAQGGLAVSEPSDPAEVEADSIAERLFPSTSASSPERGASGLFQGGAAVGGTAATWLAQRETGSGSAGAGAPCPSCASESLNGIVASSGSPLPDRTRSEMEGLFGTDFSGVRIHADARAAKLSQSLRAQAFTYGNDIFFDQGKYNPYTPGGKRLLAHELTHTVQQRGALAMLSRQGGGRTAVQCVNDNLASMGIAAWLITIVGATCGLIGALAGSPTGPGAAGTAAFGAALCIAGLTGLAVGTVLRVIYECARDPNVRVGLPGTLAEATPAPAAGPESAASAVA